MQGLIVGVDGSDDAAAALVWAAREAELHGWPITAVLAWRILNQPHDDATAGFDPDFAAPDALEELTAAVRRALGDAGAAPVALLPVHELPFRALLDASDDADLLVVGTRGRGGFTSLLLGSVSQHLVHHATCPIAIVRPVGQPAIEGAERIVVGIDGSATARAALLWAIEEAVCRGAALSVVYAWQMPYVGNYPYSGPELDPALFEEPARRGLEDALDAVADLTKDIEVLPSHPMGSAASAILDVAEGADLVVVGARGLGGFSGMMLGSVSQQLAHHARCPLVIIPVTP